VSFEAVKIQMWKQQVDNIYAAPSSAGVERKEQLKLWPVEVQGL
jgi:hypothetical protein